MKKSGSHEYQILDEKTGRYLETDWSYHKVVRNQERLYDEVDPEDRHKLTLQQTHKIVTVDLIKPMDCAACGKSSDCAEIFDEGVRYSEGWFCKRCFKTEMQQRRNHNQRNGFFQGNPNRLLNHPWPKKRRIRETRRILD